MSGRRRRRHRRRRQESWKIFLPAGAAVVVLAVIGIAVLIGTGGKKEAAAQPEETETSVREEELAVEETQAAQESSEAESEQAGTQEASEEETAIAAEVGSQDDSEDPQASANAAGSGSGAAVDVGELALAEGETDELTLGIDVSKYQGTIDWEQVKDAGVDFAMIRVGYRTKVSGIIYEDPGARYNLQEATKNGILAGAYFFSSAVTEEEARQEASWVADFIAKYKITYPVAYNCEDFQSQDSRQYGLDSAARTQIASTFLDTIAARGYTPMFYASRNEMEGNALWDMDTLGSKYRVWVSQYPEKPYPETPASTYSGTHAMWQYTSQGRVAGIDGSVDVNLAYFGYSEEAQAKDPNPAEIVEANPEVGLNFTEVDELVTAKDETNLRNLPTTEGSQVVCKLLNGETVQRTGIGSNGWDRVIYNGQRLYAVHNFLTTDLTPQGDAAQGEGEPGDETQSGAAQAVAGEGTSGSDAGSSDTSTGTSGADGSASSGGEEGPVFQAVSEAVTARDRVNLRDYPSTVTGNIVGSLSYGEAVVRTGISDTGWSRLEVNGQVVYASSRLLATSMDYKEQEKPSPENPEAGMHFTAASGMVKAKDGQTNLRTLPTTNEPSQVVGQLIGDATAQRVAQDVDRGWTKLIYNGQTVYAVSNYLTDAG